MAEVLIFLGWAWPYAACFFSSLWLGGALGYLACCLAMERQRARLLALALSLRSMLRRSRSHG